MKRFCCVLVPGFQESGAERSSGSSTAADDSDSCVDSAGCCLTFLPFAAPSAPNAPESTSWTGYLERTRDGQHQRTFTTWFTAVMWCNSEKKKKIAWDEKTLERTFCPRIQFRVSLHWKQTGVKITLTHKVLVKKKKQVTVN